MDTGWVKIHRKLLENPFMRKPSYVSLWVTLLLKANHKPKEFMWNKGLILVQEGQMITGRKQLSMETGIPESTIEDILKYLETQHQIQQQKENKYRLITIVNWKTYQKSDTTSDRKATTKQQQTDTNKNVKNVKKDTSETSSPDVSILIKSFESLNPASKKFYGNTTQRKACQMLIHSYGLERVTNVIENILPKSNTMKFFPVITTPVQLSDKWATLESAIHRYQAEKKDIKNKVAF